MTTKREALEALHYVSACRGSRTYFDSVEAIECFIRACPDDEPPPPPGAKDEHYYRCSCGRRGRPQSSAARARAQGEAHVRWAWGADHTITIATRKAPS